MAHQYIYVVHENTDEHGWQYRRDWNIAQVSNFNKENETWTSYAEPNTFVRRRIWMTTVVSRQDLIRTKRLLSENLSVDVGNVRMQGMCELTERY